MKKLLILFVLICSIGRSNTNIDSLKQVVFKPLISEYSTRVLSLTEKIRTTNNADEIKALSVELMKESRKMRREVNKFYSYKEYRILPGFALTNQFRSDLDIFLAWDLISTPKPSRRIQRIHDYALNVRLLYRKSPNKINKSLDVIEENAKQLAQEGYVENNLFFF